MRIALFAAISLAAGLVSTVAAAEPPRAAPKTVAAPAKALTAEELEPAPLTYKLGHGAPQSTIIFMHGLGGSPKGYGPLIETLLTPPPGAPAVRVVSIWMRPQDGIHTMSDQLARARRAIEAEDGPVVLMGHSFGGKAAVKLAGEYPEAKVTGVVALAPSVNMLQSYWKRITGERALPSPRVIDAKLAEVEAVLERRLAVAQIGGDKEHIEQAAGNLAYARTMRDLTKHDEPGVETTVKRPTLVLHGTDDEAVSIHYARRFAGANAGAVEIVELPGANHGFVQPENKKRDIAAEMMRDPVQAFLAKRLQPAGKAQAHVPGRAATVAAAQPKAAAHAQVAPPRQVGLFGRLAGR